jgi:hypothetical protein
LTVLGVGSRAGDVESGDGFQVSSWAYGDLFFAVQDAQVGVLNDDRDDFAAVAGAKLDALASDHDAAAGVDFSLCTQRSRGQWRRWQRCGWCSCTDEATELVGAEGAGPGADERVFDHRVHQVPVEPECDSPSRPGESDQMARAGDGDHAVLVDCSIDLHGVPGPDYGRSVNAPQRRPVWFRARRSGTAHRQVG